jgi:hypothetical protein
MDAGAHGLLDLPVKYFFMDCFFAVGAVRGKTSWPGVARHFACLVLPKQKQKQRKKKKRALFVQTAFDG